MRAEWKSTECGMAPFVREGQHHFLSLADVDEGRGRASAERPGPVLHAGGDLDRPVDEHEVDACDRTGRSRGEHGIHRLMLLRENVGVRGCLPRIAGQVARAGRSLRHVHPSHRVRAADALCSLLRIAASVVRRDAAPHGHEAEHDDEEAEDQREGDPEGGRICLARSAGRRRRRRVRAMSPAVGLGLLESARHRPQRSSSGFPLMIGGARSVNIRARADRAAGFPQLSRSSAARPPAGSAWPTAPARRSRSATR
jgi:hypothetical protein